MLRVRLVRAALALALALLLLPVSAASASGGVLAQPPSCTVTVQRARTPTRATRRRRPRRQAPALTVTAQCDQPATGTLAGTLTATAAPRRRPVVKTFQLRTAHVSLHAGVAATFTIKLPAAVLAALGKGWREAATVTLSAANANGTCEAGALLRRLRS